MGRPERFGELVRRRAASLERYSRWALEHPTPLSPSAAVEAIGALLDMMPPEARKQRTDPTGIALLHGALKHLAQ
jgi:hypothetical protein